MHSSLHITTPKGGGFKVIINDARSFDGINDYISSSFVMENNWSISFWHYPQKINDNDQFLLLGNYSVGKDLHLKYTSGNLMMNFVNASSNIILPLTVHQWYHCVITFDGIETKIYHNGELKKTVSQTPNFNFSSSQIRVGSRNGTQATELLFDELNIFNEVLSINEIIELYNVKLVH